MGPVVPVNPVLPVNPVVPTPTVRSEAAIPDLKSTPVIIIDGVAAPFAIVEVVAIVLLAAGTVTVKVLLAAPGATVKAEVLA
jgi:hypothetical protein